MGIVFALIIKPDQVKFDGDDETLESGWNSHRPVWSRTIGGTLPLYNEILQTRRTLIDARVHNQHHLTPQHLAWDRWPT